MSTREILTLQFGHYANFVGTHWWNVQERSFEYNAGKPAEINHDVLYREGRTHKGEVTFTPRLLLADLKGSLRHLPKEGDLYEPVPDFSKVEVAWDSKLLDVKKEETIEKNEFQKNLEERMENQCNLDENIEVWTDFLYTRFHPRTIHVINEYQHNNSESSFDNFPLGVNMWKEEQFQDDFSDKIRNYVEECDSFQGYHILLDSTDAFSGLSSSCIEYLRDEYENKSILALPLIPSYYDDYGYSTEEGRHQSLIKDSTRVLNLALCFDSLSQNSSLFVPLSAGTNGWRQPGPKREFYHTNYNHQLPYHSSAILASALDTFTLRHRLKSASYALSDLCVDLNGNGRKAAAASLCLPFSLNKDADLIECLDNWDGPLTKSITPNCKIGTERMMQTFTLRGVGEDRLKRPPQKAGKQTGMAAYQCKTINEMISLYVACNSYNSATNVTSISKGLKVASPYPKIFDRSVGVDGNITADERPERINVDSVPVLAGLHSGSGLGDMLESLHTEARKIKFPRFQAFRTAGLEADEFSEALDRLFDLRECYDDNYLV